MLEKFTFEQEEWLEKYQKMTGFEPMVEPDWNFDELAEENLRWYLDNALETQEVLDILLRELRSTKD